MDIELLTRHRISVEIHRAVAKVGFELGTCPSQRFSFSLGATESGRADGVRFHAQTVRGSAGAYPGGLLFVSCLVAMPAVAVALLRRRWLRVLQRLVNVVDRPFGTPARSLRLPFFARRGPVARSRSTDGTAITRIVGDALAPSVDVVRVFIRCISVSIRAFLII
ncbi:hypothetical protein CFP75_23010 [Amycolatopsis alba DSM 44262]|uniref:Uncharacterized protein n=1 Tax=Amycolatopsis alba DSM 44262 TaxID=1125972 RepID=A0A229RMV1_AMYAL|nr:hypothetical protein CFP75_23010 [Amycolatopsis alba DSM 44262]